MTRRRIWLVLAAVVIVVAAAVFFFSRPLKPPVTVGDYKFTLTDVQSATQSNRPWENPPEQDVVWITVQIERSDAYMAALGRRQGKRPFGTYPDLINYPPTMMGHAQLIGSDGTKLRQLDAVGGPQNAPWLRYLGQGRDETYSIRYEFDNSDHIHDATLTADIHDAHDQLMQAPTPGPWPVVGTLRFENIHIP